LSRDARNHRFADRREPVTAATATTTTTTTNNTHTNVIFVQRSAGTHPSVDNTVGTVCLTAGKPENVACFRVNFVSVPNGDNIFGIKTTNKILFSQRSQFIMFK